MKVKKEIRRLRYKLRHEGKSIKTSKWQGIDNPPEFLEILHTNQQVKMLDDIDEAALEANALLPWCDVHFDERVSGTPYNPPPSHELWLSGNEKYMEDGKFSHSYPERFWPNKLCSGIRYDVGDLNDIIALLDDQPETRQAYLPIYFPEDIRAAVEGHRIPCTLGYQFIVRDGRMDVLYPMRSCDALRHMHNDLYMTNRLALYVAEQAGLDVEMGIINFVVTSLHCFTNDMYALDKELRECVE